MPIEAATDNASASAAPEASAAPATAAITPDAIRARLEGAGHDVEGPNLADEPDPAEQEQAPADTEAKADDEPAEKDDDAEGADDKSGDKKLGRIGRIKEKFRTQLAERDTRIASLTEEQGKWREASTKVLAQNRALVERLQWVESILEKSGVDIDPRDRELFELRQAQQLSQFEQQMSQRAVEERTKATSDAKVQAAASRMREEAEAVAETHGLELPALVRAWHALSEAQGQTVPLEEVAQMLTEAQRQRQEQPVRAAVARQAQRNSTAPRTTSTAGGSPAAVRWQRSPEGVAAFLAANGHDVR